jgi:hypothetical protein
MKSQKLTQKEEFEKRPRAEISGNFEVKPELVELK